MARKRKASISTKYQPPSKVIKLSGKVFSNDILSVIFPFVDVEEEFALVCKQFWQIYVQFSTRFDSAKLNSAAKVDLVMRSSMYKQKMRKMQYYCTSKPVNEILELYAPQLHSFATYDIPDKVIRFPNLRSLQFSILDFSRWHVLVGILQEAPKLQHFSAVIAGLSGEMLAYIGPYLQGLQLHLSVYNDVKLIQLCPFIEKFSCCMDNYMASALVSCTQVTSLDLIIRQPDCNVTNLSHMAKLQVLILTNIFLASAEETIFFSSLPQSITELNITRCKLSKFPCIGHLKHLDSLKLDDNGLKKYILPESMHAAALGSFTFSDNESTAQVPEMVAKIDLEYCTVTSKQVFNAYRTTITLTFCHVSSEHHAIETMPRLTYLKMSSTTGNMFEQFEYAPKLRTLILDHVAPIDWNKLSFCRILNSVQISIWEMTEIPQVLVTLPSLQSLILYSGQITSISSSLLDGSCSFPSLQTLEILTSPITSLPQVTTLPCLIRLHIHSWEQVHPSIDSNLLDSIHLYLTSKHAEFKHYLDKKNALYCIHNPIRKQYFINYTILEHSTCAPYTQHVFHFVVHETRHYVICCNHTTQKVFEIPIC